MSARRSVRSVRCRKPVRPVTWAERLPRRRAAGRRPGTAGPALGAADAASAAPASDAGPPRELGPEPERLAPRHRPRPAAASTAAAVGEQRAARQPSSDAILLLPAGHPQRLDQLIQIAVDHVRQIVDRQIDPVVGHPALRESCRSGSWPNGRRCRPWRGGRAPAPPPAPRSSGRAVAPAAPPSP